MRITSCGGPRARTELEATESRGWGQGRAECFWEAQNQRKRVSGPGACAPVPFQRPFFPLPPHPALQHLLVCVGGSLRRGVATGSAGSHQPSGTDE